MLPGRSLLAGLLVSASVVMAAGNECVGGGDSTAATVAFPGAEGFGALTRGGRGGRVLLVESLADDPGSPQPGTLRWACGQSGSRIVVFRVGGLIELFKTLSITEPGITIAAQTAPGGGICLAGSPLSIETSQVIVRGLRTRPGDGPRGATGQLRRALQIIGGVSDVIVDHCSLSWHVDEGLTVYADKEGNAPSNVTVQWCLIAEGLSHSIHQQGDHSCAICLGGGNVDRFSLHHNLLAHNGARNPRIVWGARGELVNNVIYDWLNQAAIVQPFNPVKIKREKRHPAEMHGAELNIVGNEWLRGGNSDNGPAILLKMPTPETRLYLHDNVGPGRPAGTPSGERELAIVEATGRRSDREKYLSDQRPALEASGITTHEVGAVREAVLAGVGALQPERDAADRRVVDDVRKGTGRIIDSPADVGGYPAYAPGQPPADRDRDGMPDAWEQAHGLDPATPDANGHRL
ncbi:MAG TPA: hypothetical protein VHY20_07525, partial [Pirellulales bacterium]|nr:hypothetical protein [Pirellulales bacterium]